jgi:uncharacterized membrane protein
MEFLADLHPRIVHFPIAFFIIYSVFEISGIILKKNFLNKAAYIILIFGIITALLAVLTGNQAQYAAKLFLDGKMLGISEVMEKHEEFATFSIWYFSALFILRTYLIIKKKYEGSWKYIFIGFGLIGCYLIYSTGYYGGELVFKHGIGVHLQGK